MIEASTQGKNVKALSIALSLDYFDEVTETDEDNNNFYDIFLTSDSDLIVVSNLINNE